MELRVGRMERRLGLFAEPLSSIPCSGPMDGTPVIVGAMVLDIQAIPFSKELRSGTTTPGKVHHVRGGVARNVAECMTKLGTFPFLISVAGQDIAGDMLVAHWKSLGLSVEGIRRCTSVATPVVSAIFDSQGELAAAVADTIAVEEQLTPEWIGQFEAVIRSATVLMVDANLSPAALEVSCKLAKMANVPIWFEPVSVTKSVRIKTISHFVSFASPNESELVAMSNALHSVTQDTFPVSGLLEGNSGINIEAVVQQLVPSICALLESGVKHIALTLGKYGVLLCSAELPKLLCVGQIMFTRTAPTDNFPVTLPSDKTFAEKALRMKVQVDWNLNQTSPIASYIHFPALPASVVSLSGAGDCFVAGVLTALCRNMDVCTSMAYGVAAAKQAVQSAFNVPLQMPQDVITGDAGLVLAGAIFFMTAESYRRFCISFL